MRTLIVLCLFFLLSCTNRQGESIIVNTLSFPVGEILQIKGVDTLVYPSFEDATIISGYDSLTILNAITNKKEVDGFKFTAD